MKAKDLDTLNYPPSVLLYGTAGSGKTALVSQARNGFLFDFDNGMRTAVTLKDKFSELRQSIEFETFVDKDMKTMREYLRFKNMLLSMQNGTKYDAIVLDSLTGLCRSIRYYIMSCAGNTFGSPQIQHYGQMVNELETVLTILRSMNKLLLVTAHEDLVDVDNTTIIRIMSVTRKHGSNKLAWLFDEVLYTKARMKGANNIDYIVTGKTSSSTTTRTRSGILFDVVINDIGLDGLLAEMSYKQKGGIDTGK
jgi:archaellum biogenesis ATPase FlaH